MKIVPVAKALVVDADSDILVLRRSGTHPTSAYKPDFPGGIVDAGEDFGQALIREIAEETGLVVTFKQLLPVYSGTDVHGDHMLVRVLFMVHLDTPKPAVTVSWEHDQFEWQNMAVLLKNKEQLSPFYGQALTQLQQIGLL